MRFTEICEDIDEVVEFLSANDIKDYHLILFWETYDETKEESDYGVKVFQHFGEAMSPLNQLEKLDNLYNVDLILVWDEG